VSRIEYRAGGHGLRAEPCARRIAFARQREHRASSRKLREAQTLHPESRRLRYRNVAREIVSGASRRADDQDTCAGRGGCDECSGARKDDRRRTQKR
jgi:hypothetical protein